MINSDSVAADQLRAIVERIERLEADIKEINSDKSEVYKEAKGNGFDVSCLRKLIQERRQDPSKAAEAEAILELYRGALEGHLSHVRAREAAE